MRLPVDNQAYAPEFPQGLQRIGVAFLRMAQQLGRRTLAGSFTPRAHTRPPRLDPLRPEDVEGVQREPQTADIVLPADGDRVQLTGEWAQGAEWIEARKAGEGGRGRFGAGEPSGGLGGTAEPGLHRTDGT